MGSGGARTRSLLVALVALALVVRLAGAIGTSGHSLTFDARDFDRHARSIAARGGYPESLHRNGGPTAYRPPAFSYALAAAYRIRGTEPAPDRDRFLSPRYRPPQAQVDAGRILQALIGTATVALVGLIALQLWGRRVALVATGMAALYPPLIAVGFQLYSDPLFVMLELAAAAAALRARGGSALRWAAVAGVLAGLACLTRNNGYVLIPPLALLVWTARPRFAPRSLAAPALLVAAACLAIAPWTVRNAIEFDAFVPVSTNAGYTLAGTYNASSDGDPGFDGGWRPAQLDPANKQLIDSSRGELDEARLLGDAARDYALAHPAYVLRVAWCNSLRLVFLASLSCGDIASAPRYGYELEFGLTTPLAYAAIGAFAAVALLAGAGAFTRRARSAPRTLWLLPLALWTVVLVVHGTRLRAPVEPYLILLAALAVVSVWERLEARRGGDGEPVHG